MSTFGRTDTSSSVQSVPSGRMYGCRYALGETAVVSKLTAMLRNTGSTPQAFRCVIYADDGTTNWPGTLKALSNEVSVHNTDDNVWIDFSLPSTVELAVGNYYLCVFGGDTGSAGGILYTGGFTGRKFFYRNAPSGYPTAPDPLGTCDYTSGSYELAVYATYTTPVAGNPRYYYAQQ